MSVRITLLKEQGGDGAGAYVDYAVAYYDDPEHALDPEAGGWHGAAAEALGLMAKVYAPGKAGADELKEDLKRVCKGRDPRTDEILRKGADAPDARWAWDMTTSDPKEFGIILATASPARREQLLAIRRWAQARHRGRVLEQAYCRTGEGGTGEPEPATPVIREVVHFDSREGEPDPHSHTLLTSLALCRDGKWRALETDEIYDNKQRYDAEYLADLAAACAHLGYPIDREYVLGQGGRDTDKVTYHWRGITRDMVNELSTRSRQIDEYIAARAEEGIAVSRDYAALMTRQGKGEGIRELPDGTTEKIDNTVSGVTAYTLRVLERMGVAWTCSDNLATAPGGTVQGDTRTTAEVLKSLHQHESTFTAKDFATAEARAGRPFASLEDAEKALAGALAPDVLRWKDEHGHFTYTARDQLEIEAAVVDYAIKGAGDTTHHLNPGAVAQAIRAHEAEAGFPLSDEQRAEVEYITQQSGAVAVVQGEAGSGKTAGAGAYIKAFKAAGYAVVQCSTASVAAAEIQTKTKSLAANIRKTIHDLDTGKIPTPEDQGKPILLVIDEAGMVSDNDVLPLIRHVQRLGGKIVAQGDDKQLQAVGAGSWFHTLQQHIAYTSLSENRRQVTEEGRAIKAATYAGAGGEELVEMLRQAGQWQVYKDRAEAQAGMVAAWAKDPAPMEDKIMMAAGHADVAAANLLAHALRKKQGQISDTRSIKIWQQGQHGTTELTTQKEFGVGDRIVFTCQGKKKVWMNKEAATITGWVDDERGRGMMVSIVSEDAARNGVPVFVEFPQGKGKAADFDYGYAITTHGAQGQTKTAAYFIPGRSTTRNTLMVAQTRQRERFGAFVVAGDEKAIIKKVGAWDVKQSALVKAAAAIDTDWLATLSEAGQAMVGLAKRTAEAQAMRGAVVAPAPMIAVVAPPAPVDITPATGETGSPRTRQAVAVPAPEPTPAPAPAEVIALRPRVAEKATRQQEQERASRVAQDQADILALASIMHGYRPGEIPWDNPPAALLEELRQVYITAHRKPVTPEMRRAAVEAAHPDIVGLYRRAVDEVKAAADDPTRAEAEARRKALGDELKALTQRTPCPNEQHNQAVDVAATAQAQGVLDTWDQRERARAEEARAPIVFLKPQAEPAPVKSFALEAAQALLASVQEGRERLAEQLARAQGPTPPRGRGNGLGR